jgi:hypothetical protein
MKVIYLYQNHWIELARAANGRARHPMTPSVLEVLRQARALGRACFPLSYAHYLETRKHCQPDGRLRLAKLMLELSGGITVASPEAVTRHEIEMALGHCFPGRVVPEPFQ